MHSSKLGLASLTCSLLFGCAGESSDAAPTDGGSRDAVGERSQDEDPDPNSGFGQSCQCVDGRKGRTNDGGVCSCSHCPAFSGAPMPGGLVAKGGDPTGIWSGEIDLATAPLGLVSRTSSLARCAISNGIASKMSLRITFDKQGDTKKFKIEAHAQPTEYQVLESCLRSSGAYCTDPDEGAANRNCSVGECGICLCTGEPFDVDYVGDWGVSSANSLLFYPTSGRNDRQSWSIDFLVNGDQLTLSGYAKLGDIIPVNVALHKE